MIPTRAILHSGFQLIVRGAQRSATNGSRLQSFVERSIELLDPFIAIIPNVMIMAHGVRLHGGDIVLEWPSGNAFWNFKAMMKFFEGSQLKPVECNGCAVGMRGKGGGLLCKS